MLVFLVLLVERWCLCRLSPLFVAPVRLGSLPFVVRVVRLRCGVGFVSLLRCLLRLRSFGRLVSCASGVSVFGSVAAGVLRGGVLVRVPALVGAARRGLGGWFVPCVGVVCLVASVSVCCRFVFGLRRFACLGSVRFVGRFCSLWGVVAVVWLGIAVRLSVSCPGPCCLPSVRCGAVLR